jgi:hypothetical protein
MTLSRDTAKGEFELALMYAIAHPAAETTAGSVGDIGVGPPIGPCVLEGSSVVGATVSAVVETALEDEDEDEDEDVEDEDVGEEVDEDDEDAGEEVDDEVDLDPVDVDAVLAAVEEDDGLDDVAADEDDDELPFVVEADGVLAGIVVSEGVELDCDDTLGDPPVEEDKMVLEGCWQVYCGQVSQSFTFGTHTPTHFVHGLLGKCCIT